MTSFRRCLILATNTLTKYYRQVLEQETSGKCLYRSTQDMTTTRQLKSLQNTTWFKSSKGGHLLRTRKDLPYNVQKHELESRTRDRAKEASKEVNKDTEVTLQPHRLSTKGKFQGNKVKTLVFLPPTPESKLEGILQGMDDQLCTVMSSPTVRLIDRSGLAIMKEFGSNNPWVCQWACSRSNYLTCTGCWILVA